MLSTPGALNILEITLEGPPGEGVQRLMTVAIVTIEQVVEVQPNEVAELPKARYLERLELEPPSDVRRI
jgi:hypothetical protein